MSMLWLWLVGAFPLLLQPWLTSFGPVNFVATATDYGAKHEKSRARPLSCPKNREDYREAKRQDRPSWYAKRKWGPDSTSSTRLRTTLLGGEWKDIGCPFVGCAEVNSSSSSTTTTTATTEKLLAVHHPSEEV